MYLYGAFLLAASCLLAQEDHASASKPSDDPQTQSSPQRESIIVTGTFEPLPLEEADRSVRSLPVQDLQLVSNAIADFLRLDSSVDLRERAPNAIQSDVSIRGGGFGQTLILLDGVRLNDAQSGHHNMDVPVPLESLARIEVLKGSGSTLYGSDAVGGVVNFVTRPPDYSEVRLRSAVGNFGVNQERAILTYGTQAFGESFTASRDFSTGFIPDRDYRNLSLASLTRWKTKLGSTDVTLADDDRPFGADQFYGSYPSWERTRTWFASLRQELGTRTEAAFAFRRHTDLFVLYRDRPEIYTNRHAVEGYQAALRRSDPVGSTFKLFYGVEGYYDSIESSNLGNHERGRGAGYAGFDARALKRFSLSAGVREEIYGRHQTQFSPAMSGGYWVSPHLRFRASASHAFRLPSYTDLYYHDPANIGSPNLRPERAWSYEAGADLYLAGNVRASVTVFERRERDVIDYVRNSPADIWRATNFQRLNFTGVEAELDAPVTRRYTLQLGYTGLHGVQDATAGYYSKYAFNYPIHSGVVSWVATLPGGIVARARVGALERYARGPYALVDFYAAETRGRLRPFLQVTNITDTVYQEIFGVPMPGRAVVGGLEWVVLERK